MINLIYQPGKYLAEQHKDHGGHEQWVLFLFSLESLFAASSAQASKYIPIDIIYLEKLKWNAM